MCVAGGMHGGGCAWRGHAWQEGGGTHPTGMYSCLPILLLIVSVSVSVKIP